MKRRFLCFCALLMTVLLSLGSVTVFAEEQSEDDDVYVSVYTDKTDYQVGDTITVVAEVTNRGTANISGLSMSFALPEGITINTGKPDVSDITVAGGSVFRKTIFATVESAPAETETETETTDEPTDEKDGIPVWVWIVGGAVLLVAAVGAAVFLVLKKKKAAKALCLLLGFVMALNVFAGPAMADEDTTAETTASEAETETQPEPIAPEKAPDTILTAEAAITVDGKNCTIKVTLTVPGADLYTIAFEANAAGIKNLPETQKIIAGEKAVEPEEPSREGFVFVGWYCDSHGIERFDFDAPVSASYTLYARWRGIEESYVYSPNIENMVFEGEGTGYVNNVVLITFTKEATESDIQQTIDSIHGTVVGKVSTIKHYEVQIETHSKEELVEICNGLIKSPCVLDAMYDILMNVSMETTPNDPWSDKNILAKKEPADWTVEDPANNNWWAMAINLPGAWEYNNKNPIKIGIVDSGFDTGHEDLKNRIKYVNETANVELHGTHVAGIIGAEANNNKGIAGVCWNSELMLWDYKPTDEQKELLGNRGLSSFDYIWAGMNILVEQGAKIVNFSIANEIKIYSARERDDVAEFVSKYIFYLLYYDYDFVLVEASGNNNDDAVFYAYLAMINEDNCCNTYPDVTGITAKDLMDRILIVGNAQSTSTGVYSRANSSNYGNLVDVMAPGTDVYSCVPGTIATGVFNGSVFSGGYHKYSGTSMAAPVVSGVAGLVWSAAPQLSGADVKNIICESAIIDVEGTNLYLIDAKIAVENALKKVGALPPPSNRDNSESSTANGILSGKVVQASDRSSSIYGAVISIFPINNNKPELVACMVSTSTITGNYYVNLPSGDYLLHIDADGYIPFSGKITVIPNQNTYVETFLLVAGKADSTTGQVTSTGIAKGRIFNALTGRGLGDVTLSIYKNWGFWGGDSAPVAVIQTDSNGYYSVELPFGYYTIHLSKEDFNDDEFNIVVQAGTTDEQNGTISPVIEGDGYLITLTWGENPHDVDSHMVGTYSDGNTQFHVYFHDKEKYDGEIPVCILDYDDRSSYGPEHITLIPTSNKPYYYYLHRYAGSGTLASSEALVTVIQNNRIIASYNVPTDRGSGDYWNIFAIKNGRIITRNTITSSPELNYAD